MRNPTDAQVDAAAADAARQLRNLGAVALQTRQQRNPDGTVVWQIRCKVQRGRAHRTFESPWEPNIVAAAVELIAAVEADAATDGRRPKDQKPAPRPERGVERFFGEPGPTSLARQLVERTDSEAR